ncbi:zinc transporter ZIP11-like isoform X2 [Chiloscyllium plagiosum]|uniref:zinc transporter ZIP11-like isoform X2 n=1 Tax=Chiloscyllium plagiosum TaxID=36176 RepID=UPI001CB86CF1|nr:zinc transporter ZIP11-like isoform X2 [Chiloscyllium plagiosum]
MIEGWSPVLQSLLGTFFTWGLTAAGAALVFIFSHGQKQILDGSLGFAAGVMLAASYWSLLAPAIEMAESSGTYGAFSFLPVGVGFTLGATFVYLADLLLPSLGIDDSPQMAFALKQEAKAVKGKKEEEVEDAKSQDEEFAIRIEKVDNGEVYQRKRAQQPNYSEGLTAVNHPRSTPEQSSWKRIILLILAITIHNIPEGLAVGVGFGAIGKTASATFESARNLAIGIGLQNFPEGLAVSLPLRGAGVSTWKAFWYGQLSGMVEPVAGIFGAFAVVLAEPLLPYALAFAAGAMVYVVIDDIIPEAQLSGNGKLASWTSIAGFVLMMSLDVGLS